VYYLCESGDGTEFVLRVMCELSELADSKSKQKGVCTYPRKQLVELLQVQRVRVRHELDSHCTEPCTRVMMSANASAVAPPKGRVGRTLHEVFVGTTDGQRRQRLALMMLEDTAAEQPVVLRACDQALAHVSRKREQRSAGCINAAVNERKP
jgi:hypothetical protein